MKISSVSKKVLASALSAAMVVAFAPTVAFGAIADEAAWTEADYIAHGAVAKVTDKGTGQITQDGAAATYYSSLDAALTAAKNAGATKDVVVTVLAQPKLDTGDRGYTLDITGVDNEITVDFGGFELTNDVDGLIAEPVKYSQDEINAAAALVAKCNLKVVASGASEGEVNKETVDAALAEGYTSTVGDYVELADGKYKLIATAEQKTAAATVAAKTTSDVKVAAATAHAAPVFSITGTAAEGNSIVIKNAALTAQSVTTGATTVEQESVHAVEGADVTVESGAFGDVDGVDTVKAGTFEDIAGDVIVKGKVTAQTIAGNVTANQGADLTVTVATTKDEVEANDQNAVAIAGNVTFGAIASGKTASVVASATAGGYGADALAIGGTVSGIAAGATLSATAKANGYDADAKAINAVAGEVKKGTLSAIAYAADDTATGIGSGLAVSGGTVEVSAEGVTAAKSKAVDGTLDASAGTYTGSYTEGTITGGKYSVKPLNVNKAVYDVVDVDGTYWEVVKATDFGVGFAAGKDFNGNDNADNTDEAAVKTFVENTLEDIVAGKAISGITLAEGVKAEDLVKQAQDAKAQLKIAWSSVGYNAKKATAEQKAAYEALKAYATENLSLIEDAGETTVKINTLTLQYTKDGVTTTMATITDLGTVTDNREVKDNKVTIREEDPDAQKVGSIISYNGGSVEKMAWYKNADGVAQNYVTSRVIPMATAYMTTDYEALKNAVVKGEEQAPAVEKATQSIDVAQKSKTVKLAKGKTKTQKAVSFKLGASAETALTIAKKSGNSKISVSGQKITLKKGTKKGTYTAKVSIKAAASDEYLAAAKTITVKFVVKK